MLSVPELKRMIKEYDVLMKLKIPKGKVSREKIIEIIEDAGYKINEDSSPPELRHVKSGKKMKRKPEVIKLKPPKTLTEAEKKQREENKKKKMDDKDKLIAELKKEIAELKKTHALFKRNLQKNKGKKK